MQAESKQSVQEIQEWERDGRRTENHARRKTNRDMIALGWPMGFLSLFFLLIGKDFWEIRLKKW